MDVPNPACWELSPATTQLNHQPCMKARDHLTLQLLWQNTMTRQLILIHLIPRVKAIMAGRHAASVRHGGRSRRQEQEAGENWKCALSKLPLVPSFLHQAHSHLLLNLPRQTTKWGSSVQVPQPSGNISHQTIRGHEVRGTTNKSTNKKLVKCNNYECYKNAQNY